MTNVNRHLQVIEDAEEDSATSDANSRPSDATPEGRAHPADGAADAVRPQQGELDVGIPTSFFGEGGPSVSEEAHAVNEGLRGVPEESYLAGSTIGVALRQARVKQKRDLDELTRVLRIRRDYLEAIEDGDTRRLPGPTYAVGFVRAYANELGLDGADAVRRFKAETENFDATPDLAFPAPASEGRLPGGAILAVSVLAAVLLYGAWYLFGPEETAAPPGTPSAAASAPSGAAPSTGTPPAANDAASASTQSGPTSPQTTTSGAPGDVAGTPSQSGKVSGTTDGTPATTSTATATTPPGKKATQTSDATAAEPAAPAVTDGDANARVIVSAAGDSWIQVRDSDDKVIFTKLLKAGESYGVPAGKQGLTLLAGNAGAVRISVDGRMLAPLGPEGAVRRDIPLDPKKLLSGGAAD